MNKTINVGLVGYGLGGRVFHAPILTQTNGLRLVKIRESKPDKIAHAEQQYPDVKVVPQTTDILNDPEIDLVVITTPHHTHFTIIEDALAAGKHVVVDKPFTVATEEAEALIRLAKHENKLLSVYQNRRFDSDFKTVRKIIESKVLGNLVEYEVHFDRFKNFIKPDTWKEEEKPGTGILYDLGVHLIDQALFLFGTPESIYADIRIQRQNGKVPDNFELILNYTNLKVTLKSGLLVKEQGPRITLLGDKGSFHKYGLDVQEANLLAGVSPADKADWGVEPESLWGSLSTSFNGLNFKGKIQSEPGDYRAYYANIYKALMEEEELFVTPEQAKNAVKVINLAMESSKEKRTLKFS